MPRPTRADLERHRGATVDDLIGPGLRLLFVGINPGLWTAAVNAHFARPGNRFWPALHRSGFTARQLQPCEQAELLPLGLGITNVVERATATAAELSRDELVAGGQRLTADVEGWQPAWLAVLGVTAYRTAFAEKQAAVGRQERRIAATRIWVLPNPSGLNAHWTPATLADAFAELRAETEKR